MKINGLIKKARWENISCKCNHDSVETEYPSKECSHCKFMECWKSVPQDNFKINVFDDKGKKTGIKTVKEITLVRGNKYQDVIGWEWDL